MASVPVAHKPSSGFEISWVGVFRPGAAQEAKRSVGSAQRATGSRSAARCPERAARSRETIMSHDIGIRMRTLLCSHAPGGYDGAPHIPPARLRVQRRVCARGPTRPGARAGASLCQKRRRGPMLLRPAAVGRALRGGLPACQLGGAVLRGPGAGLWHGLSRRGRDCPKTALLRWLLCACVRAWPARCLQRGPPRRACSALLGPGNSPQAPSSQRETDIRLPG